MPARRVAVWHILSRWWIPQRQETAGTCSVSRWDRAEAYPLSAAGTPAPALVTHVLVLSTTPRVLPAPSPLCHWAALIRGLLVPAPLLEVQSVESATARQDQVLDDPFAGQGTLCCPGVAFPDLPGGAGLPGHPFYGQVRDARWASQTRFMSCGNFLHVCQLILLLSLNPTGRHCSSHHASPAPPWRQDKEQARTIWFEPAIFQMRSQNASPSLTRCCTPPQVLFSSVHGAHETHG